MGNYLQEGINAAKAGDKVRAFDLLTRASEIPATSEQAWLWLSSVVGDDSERLFCLDNVLRINPGNATAQRGSTVLRQKGVFPAIPVYPEPQKAISAPSPSTRLSQSNLVTSAPVAVSASRQQSSYETDSLRQDLSGLFQYAAMELAAKKSRQEVEKSLVSRGVSLETAKAVVKDAQYAVRKAHRGKYKKQMTSGFALIIVGMVLTCGSYAIADSFNGRYFLFYGAVFVGLINLVVGIIGWLVNG